MTCEIIVLNKQAVALAADSAVTVTQRVNNKEEKRYFKNVNKLFQLSREHPVGMMVYGAGDLQQVSWELLAKEFRKSLGSKCYPSLEEYGSGLLDFLRDATDLFPTDIREENFVTDCERAAALFFFQNISDKSPADPKNKRKNEENRKEKANKYLEATIKNIENESFPEGFDQADIDNAISSFLPVIRDRLKALEDSADPEKLALLGIYSVIKLRLYMPRSGVVIAGFGDKDYFPRYYEYNFHGNVLGKHAYTKESDAQIGFKVPSLIKGFATTHMVDTFLLGLSQNSYLSGGDICAERVRNILSLVNHSVTEEKVNELVEAEVAKFREDFLDRSSLENYEPLRRVVAALPLDDMAHLAETLVTLESLKEKVTRPSESVGGPIDVAIISKHEGMIWIKRKHYFNADLNPRYIQRKDQ